MIIFPSLFCRKKIDGTTYGGMDLWPSYRGYEQQKYALDRNKWSVLVYDTNPSPLRNNERRRKRNSCSSGPVDVLFRKDTTVHHNTLVYTRNSALKEGKNE